MRKLALANRSRPLRGPLTVVLCESFFCKLRGLTFRRSLPLDEGLLLVQTRESRMDSAIHMLGVWMDLGVIWLDAGFEVVDRRLARRWRPIYLPRRPAQYVLEVAASRLLEFEIGDSLELEVDPRS